jgi:hypothetical protein
MGCIDPGLLVGGLADALDGIADLGTERLEKRCRGTLELFHCVVQPVARHGSAAGRWVSKDLGR